MSRSLERAGGSSTSATVLQSAAGPASHADRAALRRRAPATRPPTPTPPCRPTANRCRTRCARSVCTRRPSRHRSAAARPRNGGCHIAIYQTGAVRCHLSLLFGPPRARVPVAGQRRRGCNRDATAAAALESIGDRCPDLTNLISVRRGHIGRAGTESTAVARRVRPVRDGRTRARDPPS